MNNEGMNALIRATIMRAIYDYKKAIRKNDLKTIKEIEEWASGDYYFGELIGISDTFMSYCLERIKKEYGVDNKTKKNAIQNSV